MKTPRRGRVARRGEENGLRGDAHRPLDQFTQSEFSKAVFAPLLRLTRRATVGDPAFRSPSSGRQPPASSFAPAESATSTAPVVLCARGPRHPLVVGYLARQFLPLPLKGLSLVRGCWHVGDDR
jgi:hypothetical protein